VSIKGVLKIKMPKQQKVSKTLIHYPYSLKEKLSYKVQRQTLHLQSTQLLQCLLYEKKVQKVSLHYQDFKDVFEKKKVDMLHEYQSL